MKTSLSSCLKIPSYTYCQGIITEKQLFRQIFTGEEKETCPFECNNLATEGDWPDDFLHVCKAQRGTSGSTMELKSACINWRNSADFCAEWPAAPAELQNFATKRLRMSRLQTL